MIRSICEVCPVIFCKYYDGTWKKRCPLLDEIMNKYKTED